MKHRTPPADYPAATGFLAVLATALGGSAGGAGVGDPLPRTGDEIVVCGQLFHTTTPVVTWMDPGGYDGYRVERRFGPIEESTWDKIKGELPEPSRYNSRSKGLVPPLPAEQIERIRGGGWTLDELRDVVDQLVERPTAPPDALDLLGRQRRGEALAAGVVAARLGELALDLVPG
ncbi:MAG: hypothetical protein AAF805_15335, partial [Planctomycetota bacterium]